MIFLFFAFHNYLHFLSFILQIHSYYKNLCFISFRFFHSNTFLLTTYISEDDLLEDRPYVHQVLFAELGCDATVQEANTQWVGVRLDVHHKGVTANVHHHHSRLVPGSSSRRDVLHHHVARV